MSSRSFAEVDNNSPTACFQRLCQVMLDGSSLDLTKKNIEDFRVILHMIMHECSKANIETGKVWVFEHCHSSAHAAVLLEYILSLSSFRKGQEERIHMIYLVNDILFHTARRQLPWMRDAMLPLLTPLLRLAYEATESAEYKAKVMKVISFWGDKNIFEPNVINNIRQGVSGQLPYDQYNRAQPVYQESSAPLYQQQSPQQIPFHHQQQYQQYPPTAPQQQLPPFQKQYSSFSQAPQRPPVPAAVIQQQYQGPPPPTPPVMLPKRYFDLPAALMVLAKNEDYKPIDPALMKFTFPRSSPSNDLVAAVDDFYKGLDLSSEDDSILDEKAESNLDAQGWEKGYLDAHFESLAQKKRDKEIEARERSRGRSRSSDTYTRDDRSYGRCRSRSRSPVHRSSRHRSYSRSRSPPRRISPRRISPRRISPRRSSPQRRGSPPRRRSSPPPRGRSPMGRKSSPPGRGRSPPRRSPPRDGYRPRRNSRSRSPPAWMQQSYGRNKNFGSAAPENKYLGLGNASDEFDSFRRNKSQAYNRREPHQPITCYKCNKIGHLARECNSL